MKYRKYSFKSRDYYQLRASSTATLIRWRLLFQYFQFSLMDFLARLLLFFLTKCYKKPLQYAQIDGQYSDLRQKVNSKMARTESYFGIQVCFVITYMQYFPISVMLNKEGLIYQARTGAAEKRFFTLIGKRFFWCDYYFRATIIFVLY